ncbi:hypothetical protein UACE39S_04896 [Ureibacillus acetophenoni]
MTTTVKRQQWLDIAKGIGIILVVFGHSGNTFFPPYIYWFHMPLFFIISGYLHKQPNTLSGVMKNNWRKVKQLLIPYVSFYLLIILLRQLDLNQNFTVTQFDVKQFILGGQNLGGYFGVFWFITTLLITQILFSFVLRFKNQKVVFLIILISYMLSYINSAYFADKSIMWNANVALLAIVYYYVGYLLKNRAHIFNMYTAIISLIISMVFFLLKYNEIYNYAFNMKIYNYHTFGLDLLIPISISFVIFTISKYIERFKVGEDLAYLGKMSLVIMYLHIPANLLAENFFQYNTVIFTIIGIILPILVSSLIFEKLYVTRYLFLGVPFNKMSKGL